VYKRASIVGVALTVLMVGLGRFETASASVPQFPGCHEDSTQIKQTSDHGGPVKLGPGSANGDKAYYYLTLTAGCGEPQGAAVSLTVQVTLQSVISGQPDADGICWRVDVDLGYQKPALDSAVLMGNQISLTYSNAVAGDQYRIRIANLEDGLTVSDHSSVDG
jgi:hypothetical protein